MLREIKSDRDEVADALRDKAGLGELNGLVTQQQFDAVRGDIEQRIGASYDKFNNQEIVWQVRKHKSIFGSWNQRHIYSSCNSTYKRNYNYITVRSKRPCRSPHCG